MVKLFFRVLPWTAILGGLLAGIYVANKLCTTMEKPVCLGIISKWKVWRESDGNLVGYQTVQLHGKKDVKRVVTTATTIEEFKKQVRQPSRGKLTPNRSIQLTIAVFDV